MCTAGFFMGRIIKCGKAEVLRIRNFDFIKSARALGVKRYNILLKHVLPNAMVAAMTFIPFTFSGAVTMLIILDFLGFGLPAGSASLGELLSQGEQIYRRHGLVLWAFFPFQ
jgi:microcin C transport system permease protein